VLGWREPENRDYAAKLIVAFLITAILGLIVKKLGFELPETATPIAWALIIGGFWMIFAEWAAARKAPHKEITWLVAILVGIAQIVAGVFPGTSRSGATIFVAMLAGTGNRAAATEFAFLVGIAFVVSTIVAFIAVKWLLAYIRSNRFTLFAVYRIILGVLLLGMAATGLIG
jgi:undecaprenyl-diphosphatase